MSQVLVLGGSGFVGRTIQDVVAAAGRADEFVFAYHRNPDRVRSDVQSVQIDLLDPHSTAQAGRFDRAIWVAGNADHGQGWSDPLGDLEQSVGTLLHFLEHFRGDLAMLSSQAVYFGLSGEIREDVDHVPNMPYGFAKLAAERYAGWAMEAGRLRTLWVHRLMYAYGVHEKDRRLLKRCARSSATGERVTIAGGGRSFLNPLPAPFLAEVIVRSIDELRHASDGFGETTNINHPEQWSVLRVIQSLSACAPFEYDVTDAGEQWPVTFYGRTNRLSCWLGRWGVEFPNVEQGLCDYLSSVVKERES